MIKEKKATYKQNCICSSISATKINPKPVHKNKNEKKIPTYYMIRALSSGTTHDSFLKYTFLHFSNFKIFHLELKTFS